MDRRGVRRQTYLFAGDAGISPAFAKATIIDPLRDASSLFLGCDDVSADIHKFLHVRCSSTASALDHFHRGRVRTFWRNAYWQSSKDENGVISEMKSKKLYIPL